MVQYKSKSQNFQVKNLRIAGARIRTPEQMQIRTVINGCPFSVNSYLFGGLKRGFQQSMIANRPERSYGYIHMICNRWRYRTPPLDSANLPPEALQRRGVSERGSIKNL